MAKAYRKAAKHDQNKADRVEDAHAAIVNGMLFAATGVALPARFYSNNRWLISPKPVTIVNEGSMNTTSKESKEIDAKVDLLSKTASFYQRSIANYEEFVKTEAKPRKKKQLEQRLETILKEIEALTKAG